MTIELHNNVYCEGEGLPVVLVHGFPVDHRMWDECAEALEAAAVEPWCETVPDLGSRHARCGRRADSFR